MLRLTKVPAVLIEVGFIDHPIEGHELMRADVQAEIARAIAEEVTLIGETNDTIDPPLTVEVITSRDWTPHA